MIFCNKQEKLFFGFMEKNQEIEKILMKMEKKVKFKLRLWIHPKWIRRSVVVYQFCGALETIQLEYIM